jgi:hypothetical protein
MGHISPQVLAACAGNSSMWTDSQLISAAAVRNVPQHRRRMLLQQHVTREDGLTKAIQRLCVGAAVRKPAGRDAWCVMGGD